MLSLEPLAESDTNCLSECGDQGYFWLKDRRIAGEIFGKDAQITFLVLLRLAPKCGYETDSAGLYGMRGRVCFSHIQSL